ncbi:LysM peptidoglycan-binding domain-containing protein [Rhodococcus sp. NPDC057014]|uniref:LysM peptidoglycan-binding domain-containing protein n=1 Tax=Rhodococcus sp. NPDC057014 TaxID=3346000 RepID=UPI0036385FF8
MSANAVRSRLAGLGYLLILVLLVAGIPAALWALRGNPLDIPWSDFEGLLASPDDGSLLIALLPLVGWAAWATFTVPILLELAATLRGVKAPKLRLLRSQQRTATFLVGGALLLLTAGTATAAPVLTQPADVRSTSPYAPHSQQEDPSASPQTQVDPRATRPAVQPVGATVTTVRGDTLWGLAQQHLGEGRRYAEILALNRTAVPEPGFLAEGLTLQLPASQPEVIRGAYTVKQGDTLWDIAERELGDPLRFKEITTPDGTPAGELITVGQQLIMPTAASAAADATPAPALVPPADAAPAPAPAPEAAPAPAPTPEAAPAPAPAPVDVAPNWKLDPVEPQLPADLLTNDAPAETDTEDGSSDVVFIGLGISAVAAAGLTGHLALRRRKQQHRRRRGERIALPAETAIQTEHALTAAADPLTTTHVDIALRHLAHHCRSTGTALPGLLTVFVGDNDIELGLVEQVSLPAPWTQIDDTTWAVDPRAFPRSVPEAEISPYPALTAVGTSDDGRDLLLNLEQIGHLAISGTPTATAGVLRALAVELAVSPIADSLHLNLVGYCADLPEAIDNGRITHSEDADTVLTTLANHLELDSEILADNDIESIAQARTSYTTSELTAPEIVLIADPVTEAQAELLAGIARHAPRIAFAAVTTESAHTNATWTLEVDDNGSAVLARPGIASASITVTTLDEESYASVLDLLTTTSREPRIAHTGDNPDIRWEAARLDNDISTYEFITSSDPATFSVVGSDDLDHAVDRPEPSDSDEITAEGELPEADHIWIRLLGEPAVTPPSPGPAEGREKSLTEIAALLITSDGGVLAADIDSKIWPHDVEAARTGTAEQEKEAKARLRRRRNEALSRLRKWLGDTETGEPALIKSGDRTGRTPQRLHDAVTTDWDYWQELVNAHPADVDTTRLSAALALVTGQPFSSDDPTAYGWADHTKQDMISAITDVAEELATRYIRGQQVPQDLAAAHTAAETGLKVDIVHEGCWRAAIIATHFSGDTETTQRLIDRMITELDALEEEPEHETKMLLSQLDSTYGSHYRIGAAS